MDRETIKKVLEKMGFKVVAKDDYTKFSRDEFSYDVDISLEEIDLSLLLIYYGDHCVRSHPGNTNGWN